MADDPTITDPPAPDPAKGDPPAPKAPAADDPPLGDGGEKALKAERAARAAAEKTNKELAAKLKEIEDAEKSESQKLQEQLATLTKERDDSLAEALRLRVGAANGLTPAQSRRLQGATQEELEADAAEFLADLAPGGAKPPPSTRPKAALRGGGDPTDLGDDRPVDEIVKSIPRR